jgi:hypothetical protein
MLKLVGPPSFAALLALAAPAPAHADAIPSCPPGTHVVMRSVPPGAMHHGGGGCVPDEVAPEAPPSTDSVAPTPPVAPVDTPPAETPPATPEAALPTAPASAPSVPAPAPAADAPPAGMCTAHVRRSGSIAPLALTAALGLVSLRRRR